ncbi:MAG: hypothetical protein LBU14_01000, partial [Candidatus Peribacteria bacterium]|nr:hypothetical protein [Candidatus Peribacteria bacterium]
KLVDIAFEMKKIADKYEISEPQSQDIEWTQENTSTDTKKSILIAISVIVILLFILIVAL